MKTPEDMLHRTLIRLTGLMSDCRDPWCVFGGTAMLLHGYRGVPIADIDVIVSLDDAERLSISHGLPNVADGGTTRFRSRNLLRPDLDGIPVEILAGFEIFADDRWREVTVRDRTAISLGPVTVFVASIGDIAEIFRLSGRPKDLERLERIGLAVVPTDSC